jgi:hypothetical protein
MIFNSLEFASNSQGIKMDSVIMHGFDRGFNGNDALNSFISLTIVF